MKKRLQVFFIPGDGGRIVMRPYVWYKKELQEFSKKISGALAISTLDKTENQMYQQVCSLSDLTMSKLPQDELQSIRELQEEYFLKLAALDMKRRILRYFGFERRKMKLRM